MVTEQPQADTVAMAECLLCAYRVYLSMEDLIQVVEQDEDGRDIVFERFRGLPNTCGFCDVYFHIYELENDL